jgi:hypothetical protein
MRSPRRPRTTNGNRATVRPPSSHVTSSQQSGATASSHHGCWKTVSAHVVPPRADGIAVDARLVGVSIVADTQVPLSLGSAGSYKGRRQRTAEKLAVAFDVRRAHFQRFSVSDRRIASGKL